MFLKDNWGEDFWMFGFFGEISDPVVVAQI